MTYQKEREQFIAQLVRAVPAQPVHHVTHAATLLLRHASTHGRLACESCNGHPAQSSPTLPQATISRLQDAWDARIAKREAQVEARIRAIAGELGLQADFGGDPRGYTVKLQLPGDMHNTLGRDGYGVPQRD